MCFSPLKKMRIKIILDFNLKNLITANVKWNHKYAYAFASHYALDKGTR